MPSPIASVIIPTYNRKDMLLEAIKSVQNQTLQDFEIMIGDDGSEDGTGDVVKSLNDNRIHYHWEVNKGTPSGARNWGIENSSGKYIAFLDDDDIWLKTKLEKQVKLMENNPELGLCHTLMVDKKTGEPLFNMDVKDGNVFEDYFMSNNFIGLPTVVFRRDVIREIGLTDTNLCAVADFEFWLRIARLYPIRLLPEALVRYRVGEGIGADIKNLMDEIMYIVDKFYRNDWISRELRDKRVDKLYYDIPFMLGGAFREWKRFFVAVFTYRQRYLKRGRIVKRLLFQAPGLTKLPPFTAKLKKDKERDA